MRRRNSRSEEPKLTVISSATDYFADNLLVGTNPATGRHIAVRSKDDQFVWVPLHLEGETPAESKANIEARIDELDVARTKTGHLQLQRRPEEVTDWV